MESMTVEEMGDLIGMANVRLGPLGEVALITTREKALWLINAGLTELRRNGPVVKTSYMPDPNSPLEKLAALARDDEETKF